MSILNKIKSFILLFIPPQNWRFAVIIVLGISVGLFATIIYISRAYSYMSESPQACINCHIMTPQYATWQRSSHGNVTTCNDCHVPHDNFISKYYFKASDGLRHSFMFTFRLEPQVIEIKDAGKSVVQENCKRCHQSFVETIYAARITGKSSNHGEGLLCWGCHREIPHGTVNSLSSTPYARVPIPTTKFPEWMIKYINKNEN